MRSIRYLILVPLLLVTAGCASSTDDATTGGDSASTPTTGPAAGAGAPTEARPSEGCGADGQGPAVEQERTITVDGTARRYLITVPTGYVNDAPLPVVFDIHGLMEGAEIHAKMSQYSALAEEEGFIVVFPHGTGDPVRWNPDTTASPNPDLDYFDAVLAEVESTLCVDEARIYATGLSNGAMFTTALLCERADVLAAAAPVAGLLDPEGCDPSRPVPVVAFHGTADPILLFNGGVDVSAIPGSGDGAAPTTTRPPADLNGPGYPSNVAAYAARNGCEAEPKDTELTPEVLHRVYTCPDGADVEFYIVVGGGHSWPSSEFSKSIANIVGPTTSDIDATRDAWEFMSQFTAP